MKKRLLVPGIVLAIASLPLGAQPRLELSVGSIVDRNTFNLSESDDNLSFKTLNMGLVFQVRKNLGLGAYLGYLYNSAIQREAAEQGVLFLAYPINYGLKAVLGNVDRGFGLAVNIGTNPTLGLYWKRCFVNAGWGYSEALVPLLTESSGAVLRDESQAHTYPYIEAGYSFALE